MCGAKRGYAKHLRGARQHAATGTRHRHIAKTRSTSAARIRRTRVMVSFPASSAGSQGRSVNRPDRQVQPSGRL